MTSMKEIMKQRKSVRTYDGRELAQQDRQALEEYVSALTNPFGVPVHFSLLDMERYNLSSPVIVGEHTYLAAKVAREGQYEIAFGYAFEMACLFALTRGMGTVMLASTLSRDTFEKALEVGENEVMPVASPVGYPAEKRSIREKMMRKGIKADERLPFEKLFFEGTFEKGLAPDAAAPAVIEALEMVRIAPSAANKQPWRAVVDGKKIHFYEAKTMKDSQLGDIQMVDIGIGLAHFELSLKENGVSGAYCIADPGIEEPDNVKYVVTYEME